MSPAEATILFDRLSKTARQGRDEEWVHVVVQVLHLPGCYVPAAQKVLRSAGWRRNTGIHKNPIGYVKTATEREGLRMGLGTHRHDPTEPRVPTTDKPRKREVENRTADLRFDHVDQRRGQVSLSVPRGVTVADHIDQLDYASLYATKNRRGTWHQGSGEQGGYEGRREAPAWLQRDDDPYTVNWEIVAKYAALKAHLAPSLAKTLYLRLERRIGRPAAIRAATSPQEAREIGAAWKWIDRNINTRIASLFRLSAPPASPGPAMVRDGRQKSGFIPAAEALRAVLDAHSHPRGSS
jgi:hypothetical protein